MTGQRRTSTTLSVVVTMALLAAVVALHPSPEMASVRRLVGLGDQPALSLPSLGGDGVHAFLQTQPGSAEPVGWNPCQPIAYAVNPASMPDRGRDLVDRAVARISEATGLTFEDAGETGRRPFDGSVGRADVVIGWGDEDEFEELGGKTVGLGGSASALGRSGRRYYVRGSVALDTDTFTDKTVALRAADMEAVVVHELGHVVGLAHVDSGSEMMAADGGGRTDFGAGDRAGLALLGAVPCA